jgi:hypothetical protein
MATAPKSQRAKREEAHRCNEGAAWIILSDPDRYAGLPVEWAERWRERYGQPKRQQDEPVVPDPDSLEGRYARRERSKIAGQRRRWLNRPWRISRKGNPYTTARGNIHAVIFRYGERWCFRVTNTMTEEAIPSKASYAGVDEAKAAMFDTVLYLRSKSQMAHPGLLCKEAE